MKNPGNPATLVPAEPGNTRAVKHAAYSERLPEPRAKEIAAEVLAAPWASNVEMLGHHSPAFTLAVYVHLLPYDLAKASFMDEVLPVPTEDNTEQPEKVTLRMVAAS